LFFSEFVNISSMPAGRKPCSTGSSAWTGKGCAIKKTWPNIKWITLTPIAIDRNRRNAIIDDNWQEQVSVIDNQPWKKRPGPSWEKRPGPSGGPLGERINEGLLGKKPADEIRLNTP
jgi:hypothetical protein